MDQTAVKKSTQACGFIDIEGFSQVVHRNGVCDDVERFVLVREFWIRIEIVNNVVCQNGVSGQFLFASSMTDER